MRTVLRNLTLKNCLTYRFVVRQWVCRRKCWLWLDFTGSI